MLVRKYGGSSLASAKQILQIAKLIPEQPQVIVVSAPYGRTNELYRVISEMNCTDIDVCNQLLALGEKESCLSLQMALQHYGKSCRIMTEEDTGIKVDQRQNGRIIQCHPEGIKYFLAKEEICIVPGFQAQDLAGQRATLNRGGSDDTAVALALALGLECHIFSNVDCIYDQDKNSLGVIGYDGLLELIEQEAPMSTRSIDMAKQGNIGIWFKHWSEQSRGTFIGMESQCGLKRKINEKQSIE